MVTIREERAEDADRISALTSEAFAGAPHSSGTEAGIVEALRQAGALSVSLVAVDSGIVGHVAFSPVTIDGPQGAGTASARSPSCPAGKARGSAAA